MQDSKHRIVQMNNYMMAKQTLICKLNIDRCLQNSLSMLGSCKSKFRSRMTWCRYLHSFHGDKVQDYCQGDSLWTGYKKNLKHRSTSKILMKHLVTGHVYNCHRNFHSYCKPIKIKNSIFVSKREYATEHKIDDGMLMNYLEGLNTEYNKIIEGYTMGSKSLPKDSKSRKVFLTPLVNIYIEMKEKYKEIEELKQLGADILNSKDDEDMDTLVEGEVKDIQNQIDNMKQQILDNLVPDTKYDKNDAILELNPGVGGEEAKLFTLDMYNMYAGYAEYKGWTFIPESMQKSDNGGLSGVIISISGYDVFKWLKYESGIHRVQRVPKTERGGRVHTSTSSVAILPKPNEIDITIDPKDLRTDTFKSSGPGGQHVQTTDSAVRITHIPSGVVATCQDSRSQIQNKKIALDKIRTRLYEKEFTAQINQIRSSRKLQVGTSGRSEKIRTYNYGQNRVTDHRIHHSVNDLAGFLTGGHALDEFIQKLLEESRKETLLEMMEDFKDKKS